MFDSPEAWRTRCTPPLRERIVGRDRCEGLAAACTDRRPVRTVSRAHGVGGLISNTESAGYQIPEEFEDLRSTIRAIAQQRIVPRAPQIDRDALFPDDIRQLLAENDILALPFAEEYGGTGTGTLMLQMAVEEIAKADAYEGTNEIQRLVIARHLSR